MIPDSVLRGFKGKRVLVTGGTGMIGRQVVEILLETGVEVMTVSLDEEIPGVPHIQVNLMDFGVCKAIITGFDCVLHLAGMKGSARETGRKPATYFILMAGVSLNVLEACRQNQVKSVVYTSSIGAYGEAEVLRETNDPNVPPMDFCAWGKRFGELQIQAYIKEFGLENFAVVRPCAVYGPHDRFHEGAMVIPALMHRIRRGADPLVVWGDGSAVRDFAYSRDIAEGVILASHYGTRGGFVNLGSGEGHSVREVVETLGKITGCRYEFDPSKAAGYPRRVMDISRAREWLGWEPSTSLEEGLRKTWEWYSSQEG
ncbi:MAG: NAD(P)-dependent oxidoreductase [Chloroflexota bacterium]